MIKEFEKTRRLIEDAAQKKVVEGVLLANFTSFKIGGKAAMFISVDSIEQLSQVLKNAAALKLSPLILGGGTNMLVSDDGFDGLVIHLAIDHLQIDEERNLVKAGAGLKSAVLVEKLVAESLAGLEFAAGLPGTLGGAIAGNAGCFGSSFGEKLGSATVVTARGAIVTIKERQWFDFGYRHSSLAANGGVIAEAQFQLSPGNPQELREESNKGLNVRAERHPTPLTPTAGSYFKNLPPDGPGMRRRAAGALLDRVGAKELSVGDAAVFERHANIVVNKGKATAVDVLTLTALMARLVFERFGVRLYPEVRFIGRRPDKIE